MCLYGGQPEFCVNDLSPLRLSGGFTTTSEFVRIGKYRRGGVRIIRSLSGKFILTKIIL